METTTNSVCNQTIFLLEDQSVNRTTFRDKCQVVKQDTFQLNNDQVTLSYSSEPTTTYKYTMSSEGTFGDAYELLRELALILFKEQSIDYKIKMDNSEIDISLIPSEKAQELIAKKGYLGVEKTSERIFDLALGVAGGDPARIDGVREGVENGFQKALDAFGGWLPDISYDTYDTVMKKLDDWTRNDLSQQTQA